MNRHLQKEMRKAQQDSKKIENFLIRQNSSLSCYVFFNCFRVSVITITSAYFAFRQSTFYQPRLYLDVLVAKTQENVAGIEVVWMAET